MALPVPLRVSRLRVDKKGKRVAEKYDANGGESSEKSDAKGSKSPSAESLDNWRESLPEEMRKAGAQKLFDLTCIGVADDDVYKSALAVEDEVYMDATSLSDYKTRMAAKYDAVTPTLVSGQNKTSEAAQRIFLTAQTFFDDDNFRFSCHNFLIDRTVEAPGIENILELVLIKDIRVSTIVPKLSECIILPLTDLMGDRIPSVDPPQPEDTSETRESALKQEKRSIVTRANFSSIFGHPCGLLPGHRRLAKATHSAFVDFFGGRLEPRAEAFNAHFKASDANRKIAIGHGLNTQGQTEQSNLELADVDTAIESYYFT